jgi:hypothetical protein
MAIAALKAASAAHDRAEAANAADDTDAVEAALAEFHAAEAQILKRQAADAAETAARARLALRYEALTGPGDHETETGRSCSISPAAPRRIMGDARTVTATVFVAYIGDDFTCGPSEAHAVAEFEACFPQLGEPAVISEQIELPQPGAAGRAERAGLRVIHGGRRGSIS